MTSFQMCKIPSAACSPSNMQLCQEWLLQPQYDQISPTGHERDFSSKTPPSTTTTLIIRRSFFRRAFLDQLQDCIFGPIRQTTIQPFGTMPGLLASSCHTHKARPFMVTSRRKHTNCSRTVLHPQICNICPGQFSLTLYPLELLSPITTHLHETTPGQLSPTTTVKSDTLLDSFRLSLQHETFPNQFA